SVGTCSMKTVQRSTPADQAAMAQALRYKPAVLAFLTRRVADRAEAEDLLQEILASLSRRADLGSVGDMERYIFQAAATPFRDRARMAARRPDIEHEGIIDPHHRLVDEISPERTMLGREAYARMITALRALPERARTIFILCRLEEMTG